MLAPAASPLPPHLPRIEHRHEPESCRCGDCAQGLVGIGEDITEQLDSEPARFFVHRHIRPQYTCPHCETGTAVPVPPAVIAGGMAATGLLVGGLISNFLDPLPRYRLAQMAARQGVPLALSTLAEWVGRLGVALQPLADWLAELQRLRPVLHADETPVRQLDPGGGKTQTAYLWAYRSNGLEGEPPLLLFSITRPVARANTPRPYCAAGKAIPWSMITPATRPYSRTARSPNRAVWPTLGASFSTWRRPTVAPSPPAPCAISRGFTAFTNLARSPERAGP